MRRREFLAGVGGTVAWSFAARAQRGERVRRIGVLFATTGTSEEDSLIETFQATLRSLGWIEGRNVELHKRFIGPLGEDAAQHAKELVGLKPDVLVAGPTSAVLALRRETQTIPIVFVGVSDERIVPNIARPDSNLTGFSTLALLVIGKGLQLFKEIAPNVTRVEALFSPSSPISSTYFRTAETAAQALGITMIAAEVRDRFELERAIMEFAREPNGGLYLLPDSFTSTNRDLVVELAARYRLPAVYGRRIFVEQGGLMSFDRGNRAEEYRGAASYVDRILRGEKPRDLPVQQPTQFEFVLNLKTAKALGLTVPETLLAIADKVIE
jgi:putative tryptophan/tyrosine transport system substrate-binding protein